MYGIPNMKLEKDLVERRINLLADEGITFKTNTEIGKDISAKELMSQFDAVVLAVVRPLRTTSSPRRRVGT